MNVSINGHLIIANRLSRLFWCLSAILFHRARVQRRCRPNTRRGSLSNRLLLLWVSIFSNVGKEVSQISAPSNIPRMGFKHNRSLDRFLHIFRQRPHRHARGSLRHRLRAHLHAHRQHGERMVGGAKGHGVWSDICIVGRNGSCFAIYS